MPFDIYKNFITLAGEHIMSYLTQRKGEDSPLFPKALGHVFFSTNATTYKDSVCRLSMLPNT